HVDGSTPIKDREKIYSQLAAGEIKVLSSCMALTEGFDVPSVEAIVLARPTLSKALYFQMVGRGLRLSPQTDKHDCLVLDFAGNVERHGFIEDLKLVSLDNGKSSGIGNAPTKICSNCRAIVYAFYQKCPVCGQDFEVEKIMVQLNLRRQLRTQDLQLLKQYRSDLKIAYQTQKSPGWAAIKFKQKNGYFPPDDWAKAAVFGDNNNAEVRSRYQERLSAIASRLEKDNGWIERYLRLEFGR
ncbi:MAG: helicase-related protein, partial [Prochloraceae cyanobacterium]